MTRRLLFTAAAVLAAILALTALRRDDVFPPRAPVDSVLADGQRIFRFETFGDEAFWTDTLRLNDVIQRAVDPTTALSVGLKVDADVLPRGILQHADLHSPATTVALLKLNAIVGVQATVDANNTITRLGVTCALCHSNVDNSVMPGIGHRIDGAANRDLNPGAILALSPALQDSATLRVLRSWGPGKYDARWNRDGQNGPVVIPPAYGLAGVNLATYTGEGSIPYWNAYVAVTQMHGRGAFMDPRSHPDVGTLPDLVTSRLPALQLYQLSLRAPAPAPRSYDAAAARRGEALFNNQARCATCHVPPIFTEPGLGLHDPAETGADPQLARRGTTGKYRTTPLRALAQHPPYFHDGSAATLADVVDRYDRVRSLALTPRQKTDLVEYLKSL